MEISVERYEDEDAHIRIYPPPSVDPEEAARIELMLGELNQPRSKLQGSSFILVMQETA